MKQSAQKATLARYGKELRIELEESVQRMIRSKVLTPGDCFYCAEEMTGFINVWSGQGQQPQWIRELQAKGVSLDTLKAIA